MQSASKRNKFDVMGEFIAVSFNEIEVTHNDETHYQYDFVKIPICCDRDEIINYLMKVKYSTFDKEIAAMVNGGDDAQEHSDWRVMAKSLADEVLEFRDSEIF